jgi:hypothetical protein
MVLQVSGGFPVAEVAGHLQGQSAAVKGQKREEGADPLRLHSVRERAAGVEGEKNTDAHHV